MHKYILMLCFIGLNVLSGETVKYDVSFSIFGKVGEAEVKRIIEKDRYLFSVSGVTMGIAKVLSNGRKESYISQGAVLNGTFVPDVLVKVRQRNDRVKYKVYIFEHEKRSVTYENIELKTVTERSFDVAGMRFITHEREKFYSLTRQNDYYARNDIVSLYFNAHRFLESMKPGELKIMHAVGIKTMKGELKLSKPSGKELEHMHRQMPSENCSYFAIGVAKDIFAGNEGDLQVCMGPSHLPFEAMLEDVVMFGDVRAKHQSFSLMTASH